MIIVDIFIKSLVFIITSHFFIIIDIHVTCYNRQEEEIRYNPWKHLIGDVIILFFGNQQTFRHFFENPIENFFFIWEISIIQYIQESFIMSIIMDYFIKSRYHSVRNCRNFVLFSILICRYIHIIMIMELLYS